MGLAERFVCPPGIAPIGGDDFTGIEYAVGPTIGIDDPAKRLVLVLTCYLDDSGTADEPFVTIAGYLGPYALWTSFERAAKLVLDHCDVDVVSGKQLHRTKGDFKGWKIRKKEKFVTALQRHLKDAAVFGMTFSIEKEPYARAKIVHGKNKNESAYGYAFRIVMDTIFRSKFVREAFAQKGWRTNIVIEQGNKNNADANRIYNHQLIHAPYGKLLGGFTEAPKDSTISLQMADLLAYYSRRHVELCERKDKFVAEDGVFSIITGAGIPIANSVANDFHPPEANEAIIELESFVRSMEGRDFPRDRLSKKPSSGRSS
jgi:Protein of unknown function (DUF3800)